jgi:membrane fusion protein (multidrug efflux system)
MEPFVSITAGCRRRKYTKTLSTKKRGSLTRQNAAGRACVRACSNEESLWRQGTSTLAQTDGEALTRRSRKDSKEEESSKDKDGGEKAPDKPHSKKPLIIVAIVVVVGAVIGFFVWFAHRNQVSTDDAYTDGNVVTMVSKVSGYVVALNVDDNVHVKKGDLLLRIDPRDYLTAQAQADAELGLAKAQLKSAQDALRIARVQYPAQLISAQAQQQAAAAAFEQAQRQFDAPA